MRTSSIFSKSLDDSRKLPKPDDNKNTNIYVDKGNNYEKNI